MTVRKLKVPVEHILYFYGVALLGSIARLQCTEGRPEELGKMQILMPVWDEG